MKTSLSVWSIQQKLLSRLKTWACVNLIGGYLLLLHPGKFYQAVGQQFVAWGLINLLISIFGKRSLSSRQATSESCPAIKTRERTKLTRILWGNTILDIFYISGGLLLARSKNSRQEKTAGHGIGIIIQGAGLFILDLYHALLLHR